MQSKTIKKLKSFLSYSLKLFILTSFLLSQSFIAEIFLYQNNPNTKVVNTAKADYNHPWYNTSWSYRKPITIHSSEVSHTTEASQSNFPVLISLTNPDLKTTTHGGKVQNDPNGYDIIFSQDGSIQLDHEMEKYDPTTGEVVAWVKIPILSSVADTTFYIYYGNSGITTTQEHKNNVWNDGIVGGGNFKGVWHLRDTNDSTVNANNSTNQSNLPSETTSGQIDGAESFNGSSQYIDAGKKSSLSVSDISISAWINPASVTIYPWFVGTYRTESYALRGVLQNVRFGIHTTTGTYELQTATNPLVDGNWIHVFETYNSSGGTNNVKIYINGALNIQGTYTGNISALAHDLSIGNNIESAGWANGTLDEVRISDTVRSADWIKTEYNNEFSPSSFYTLGGEENYTQYSIPPVLAQVTPVPTPTNSTTPFYTFSSTKSGTITYGIGCSSSATSAVAGNNLITFNTLSAGIHSDCTIQVTDAVGNHSAPLQVSTFTIDPNVTWYNVLWSYRKQITINHIKVPHTGATTNLSNFPALISITNDTGLKLSPTGKVTKADGSDIIFANQAGTQLLNYEIESYDSANGNLTAWVKIPTLYDASGTQDTTIYMYYGNANATANTQTNINAVWDTNYKGVWHLGEHPTTPASGDYKDSTINANNSTNTANEPSYISSGQVGAAQIFNGTSGYIDTGNANSLNPGTNDFTLGAWINTTAGGNIMSKNAYVNPWRGWYFSASGNTLRLNMLDQNSIVTTCDRTFAGLSDGNWHQVIAVKTYPYVKLFVDGVQIGSNCDISTLTGSLDDSTHFDIGSRDGMHNLFTGTIDEPRVSDTARSADWIKTEYNNELSPSSFYVLGGEENTSPPTIAEITPISTPTNNATPSYTFSSTKSGIITYGGDCSSLTTSAVSGNNTIIFNILSPGTHSNCTIQAIDGLGSHSNTLSVRSFIINTTITTYVVPAITDNKILPRSSISSSYMSDNISSQISLGEYKATSFVINSNVNISSLQVEASNLSGGGNTILGSAIDIKTVKCWYQGGYNNSSIYTVGRYLTPELLLKDDSLVNVDGDSWNQWSVSNSNGKNYLKLTDGSYIDISSDTPQEPDFYSIPIANRPVQDATTLQPVNLPANYNKQFWITLHVPDNTTAGNYTGTVSLKSGNQTVKSLNVNIQVLPITLPNPNIEYSVYYRGTINGNGSISSENKTVQQYTAEQIDMQQHGITNPTIYPFNTDNNLLQELSIRQQAGLDNTNMYYVGGVSINNIPYYKSLTAPYGVVNLYQYGPDEASLNDSTHRAQLTNEHNAGGKHFDALRVSDADSVADLLDLTMVGGWYPALAAKYHSYGHKVYSYFNPQTVSEYPKTFRMNYGLAIWQNDYDGVMDYAYQHSAGDIWNDFDNSMRDHVFAYPTANGVIDTVQYEGFRESINDMRYLAALQNAIANSQSSDTTKVEAENYLTNLKISDLTNQDPDVIRSQMISYIIALTSISHSLNVNQGTDSGFYTKGSQITITANTPQTGMAFDKWTGDTEYVNNTHAATTTVTMPSYMISLTATYKTLPGYWYASSYSSRRMIAIDHTKVSNTDQPNFPILVSLTDPNLKSIASGGKVQNSSGYDIIFTLPDKTLLNYEIESYDGDTGKLVAWVKIPTLSASMNTIIYMYYGNSNATANTQANINSTWDTDFKGVWHLGENPPAPAIGDYKDSTVNTNDSVNNTNEPSALSGQIGGAQSFNGTSGYIDAGSGNSLDFGTDDFTLGAWINTTVGGNIMSKNAWANPWRGWYFSVLNNNTLRLNMLDQNSVVITCDRTFTSLSNGDWHQVTAVKTYPYVKLFVDGVQVGSSCDISTLTESLDNSAHFDIGSRDGMHSLFSGTIDEPRVSDNARSADWIKTEYNNESSPNTFSTLSLEETILPPTVISLTANLPTGTYGTGTAIPIIINFSKAVTSTGNITITLNTEPARTCILTLNNDTSGSCVYTVQSGDSSALLNAIVSGTIRDQIGNTQDQLGNLLTNFTPLSNLSDNTTININTSSSPFTPPTKPNITTIQSAANSGTNIDPQSIPSNITQIAISLTPDFKGISWIDFDRKKFSTINQTTQTLYIKLRTNEGAVSDTIIITPQSSINNTISLIDGDIIQCKSSNDPNAVYIVKIIGNKIYIRHITSIQIFNYYKHLKWENLKQVDSLTPFSLSSWVRVNTNTNGLPKAGDKVYEINGDQSKHWINMTAQQFLTHGGSDEAIYTVNTGELNLYSAGADVVSL